MKDVHQSSSTSSDDLRVTYVQKTVPSPGLRTDPDQDQVAVVITGVSRRACLEYGNSQLFPVYLSARPSGSARQLIHFVIPQNTVRGSLERLWLKEESCIIIGL